MYRQVIAGRLQVLAKGNDIHADFAQVLEGLQNFVVGFTQTDHQAGLCQHLRTVLLGVGQHVQGLAVSGARVAYLVGQAFDGFDVLGEDFQA